MANVNDLKKELSKLSGVDFFNPKYRNVFKKYMTTETEVEDSEEERLRNILGEEKEADTTEEKVEVETKVEKKDNEDKEELKTKEEIIEDSNEDEESEDDETIDTETKEEVEVEEESDDEDLEDEDIDDEYEESEESEDDSIEESETEEVEEDTIEEYHEEEPAYNKELIDTKVELGLVKAGVRDDRLEDARKLFMADFKGMEDLEHLGEFIKKYPEWIKKGVHDSRSFGMPIKDMGDGYTEEEKKLRSMGINPR